MRATLLLLCTVATLFATAEVERIERAVKEIAQLREALERCREGEVHSASEGLRALSGSELTATRLETCLAEREAVRQEGERVRSMLLRMQRECAQKAEVPCTPQEEDTASLASLKKALHEADVTIARLRSALAQAQALPKREADAAPVPIVAETTPCPPLSPFPKLLKKR